MADKRFVDVNGQYGVNSEEAYGKDKVPNANEFLFSSKMGTPANAIANSIVYLLRPGGSVHEYFERLANLLEHVLGGILIFARLYSVLWGKYKENKEKEAMALPSSKMYGNYITLVVYVCGWTSVGCLWLDGVLEVCGV
ncbi:clavaminate synthase-like protein [Iris pallida]|uniref:Clavaminate synthase-like protein n=1 Tax=Iris pallida TaxID=29817 RepID=A0AAX6G9M3_IRIPA|nr:clavaminate synthase-like protein [Iris pallida]